MKENNKSLLAGLAVVIGTVVLVAVVARPTPRNTV